MREGNNYTYELKNEKKERNEDKEEEEDEKTKGEESRAREPDRRADAHQLHKTLVTPQKRKKR